MPKIAEASDKNERNKILSEWIDQFGKIREITDYSITDSSLYSRIINFDWIYDESQFDNKLINKLDRIKNAERDSLFNYYVVPYRKTRRSRFYREKSHPEITWEDQGYRILTLFRFWNAMQYCFPYVEMTDKKWNEVLTEFIPLFLTVKSKADYELLITRLTAQINDPYLIPQIPSHNFGMGCCFALEDIWYLVPATLCETQNGKIVVVDTETHALKRGDILLRINGREVSQMIHDLLPYTSVSTHAVCMRKILCDLLHFKSIPIEFTCLRNGEELTTTYESNAEDLSDKEMAKIRRKSWADYAPDAKNIAYIDLWLRSKEKTEDIIRENWEAKGIIFDFRTYPSHFLMIDLYNQYFAGQRDTFCWISQNQKASPGNYKFAGAGIVGNQNPDCYKGKIALLVDECTGGYVERCVMAYSKRPKSKVIGSTTAGADGDDGYFYLPGRINILYTVSGLYYPHWEICQRKGIHIDQEIKPTLKDIREGRDLWIEQGIKYIMED